MEIARKEEEWCWRDIYRFKGSRDEREVPKNERETTVTTIVKMMMRTR